MKHVATLTKGMPAKAFIGVEDHPALQCSIQSFIEDPVGTILLHLCKVPGGNDDGTKTC